MKQYFLLHLISQNFASWSYLATGVVQEIQFCLDTLLDYVYNLRRERGKKGKKEIFVFKKEDIE